MTTRIRILPEHLCNKIAAGEVVERPASVVKELLENALDAGAGQVVIEVESGGKRLIRVTDDGEGMGRDDVLLAVERHATSKISSDEDLFRLRTFGFRGEALPSIAAVSRLTIRSRSAGEEIGWEVYLEGGTVRRADAAGLPEGTQVEVRNLFFNTPGRRKFLRRDETELGHVGDVATKMALAHPEVRFRLLHNQRALFDVPAARDLRQRVAALLGRPLLQDLLPLRSEQEDLALHGLVARPGQSRSTTGAIYTFINGRYVRDRVVQHAVLEGYRNLLMKGRYPVAVLFLDIDPALVDVNVHPTKHEVRFREQRRVHDFIAAAIRTELAPADFAPHPGPDSAAPASPDATASGATAAGSFPAGGPEEARRTRIGEALERYQLSRDGASDDGRQRAPVQAAVRQAGPQTQAPAFNFEAGEQGGYFGSLRIVGQFRNSYLLCEDGDALIVIDQHAAHERIGFERLKQQYRSAGIERQMLLFPEVLELDFREADQLNGHLEEFARLGFDIDPFGGRSFAVKAVPRLLDQAPVERLLRDVAADLAALGASGALEDALDAILVKIACHGMIRANQSLDRAQMQALLKDLDTVDFRGHCPHGRPVVTRLDLGEIERMFKRT